MSWLTVNAFISFLRGLLTIALRFFVLRNVYFHVLIDVFLFIWLLIFFNFFLKGSSFVVTLQDLVDLLILQLLSRILINLGVSLLPKALFLPGLEPL